ncbi:TPA: SgrR family transcriptional regulator [Vibrio vulnificus]|nr:SgrR family transcriptional regulator [Vibrio vulnificus]
MSEINLRRFHQLLSRYELYTCHSVNIDDLEKTLSTSRRNTSIVMKNLSESGWIEWQPSVGRSRTSQLKVVSSFDEALCDVIAEELKHGRFTLITRLLEVYGQATIRALTQATERQNQANEENNQLLVTQYPWVDTLDPLCTMRLAELQVIKSVYDTLFKQDEYGELKPSLAHAWHIEGRKLHIWLRPDIVRHDGKILSAQHVAWSLERLSHSQGPVLHLYEEMEQVLVKSTTQIEISLRHANQLFPYLLAMPHSAIVCPDSVKCDQSHCYFVGTGPFRIERWNRDRLILMRHNEYFAEKALLHKITLSHAQESLFNAMSFNNEEGDKEVTQISAFSYLTYHRRQQSGISSDTWQQLYHFLERAKVHFDRQNAVDGIDFQLSARQSRLQKADLIAPPSLSGRLVLAEPKWTIPYLADIAAWLHETIRSTGLELDVVELTEISRPESVRDIADVLFIEEVIEAPLEYGLYEWLLIASGLRFALNQEQWQSHKAEIALAVGQPEPLPLLQTIERALYQGHRCLPLFVGREEITKAQQVQGIQVRKTGYSDFYKLWIGDKH